MNLQHVVKREVLYHTPSYRINIYGTMPLNMESTDSLLAIRQGIPLVEYFNFPWWIILGSILFAIAVSLVSGIYPAVRALRFDPVVALRHD